MLILRIRSDSERDTFLTCEAIGPVYHRLDSGQPSYPIP